MVIVCVADEEDFCVGEFEAESLNVFLDERGRRREIAVDKDISPRSDHQVRSEVLAAHVIEIASDMKRWKRPGPRAVILRGDMHRKQERRNQRQFPASLAAHC